MPPPDSATQSTCPLCAGQTRPAGKQAGYREPAVFEIWVCERCRVAFPSPRVDATEIYDAIYRQVNEVPGYRRYETYAEGVLGAPDPLTFLAKNEDVYWGVAQEIKTNAGRILEVGCGLGYLTYALVRRGFDVTGIDVSAVAIEAAKRRYGGYFRAISLEELARDPDERFDTIVFTEVLEHVSDPKAFLQAAAAMLNPGGRLILTTPNRSAYAPDVRWATDCPPVHQWWFAEESIFQLAAAFGLGAKLVDFTAYNRLNYTDCVDGRYEPFVSLPRLDADGRVRPDTVAAAEKTWKGKLLERFGLTSQAKTLRARWRKTYHLSSRRPTLCAILKKPA